MIFRSDSKIIQKQRELIAVRRKLEKPYFGDDVYEETQANLAEMEQKDREQSPDEQEDREQSPGHEDQEPSPEREVDDASDRTDQQSDVKQQVQGYAAFIIVADGLFFFAIAAASPFW